MKTNPKHQCGRSSRELQKSSNGLHKSLNGHHLHVCSRSPQEQLTNGAKGQVQADQGAATGSKVKKVEFAEQLEAVGGENEESV